MKTMRDTEVRLSPPMLRHALREWGGDKLSDDNLIRQFASVVEATDQRESASEPFGYEFDTEEIVFQSPLPSTGIQKRFTSPTVNEWVCFAPGYPAWEMVA